MTTVSGFVPQFEMGNVRILQEMGYEVHYAANYHMPSYGDDNSRLEGTGIIRHQVDFERSPYSRKNLAAYRQLKELMVRERFQLVHCHTPMGGALARLAAHATHTGPVVYTAHGFHFFRGRRPFAYIACGKGKCLSLMREKAEKLGLQSCVWFLGYREDLRRILGAADVFLMSSYREWLPTVVMEAMGASLPVIGTDIRGNRYLISPGETGYLGKVNDGGRFETAFGTG